MSRSSVEIMGTPEGLSYWVPGEMIVVVRLPKRPAEDMQERLVEQVRSRLNEVLAQYQMTLELYGTTGRWDNNPMMPPIRRGLFLFGLLRQQPLAAIFFHVQHANPKELDPMPMALVYLQSHLERLAQVGLQLVSAMPNWLVTAAPVLYAEGGPAMPPRPSPSLDIPTPGSSSVGWHLSLAEPSLSLDPNQAEEVLIAVLDTAHHPDQLRSAASHTEFRRNWLLQSLVNDLKKETGSFEIEYDRYPIIGDVRTGRDFYNDPRYYFMPDHGVFLSGLIRDLAPRAHIRLVRILNDSGGCDLYNLFAALTDLEQEVFSGEIRSLVVNLSLTALPDVRRLPYIWFEQRQWPSIRLSEAIRTIAHLEDGLRLLCECLSEHRVLIVASAGNDSLQITRQGKRPRPPRAPARYESVLSVTSVNSRFKPSIFANAANIPPAFHGVATFGGDGYELMDANELPDAVRGVYISPFFPGSEQNLSGWADWSGSSFATAIISALGAHLMAQGLTAPKAMHRLTTVRDRRADTLFGVELDAPALQANVVRVQQRFGS